MANANAADPTITVISLLICCDNGMLIMFVLSLVYQSLLISMYIINFICMIMKYSLIFYLIYMLMLLLFWLSA